MPSLLVRSLQERPAVPCRPDPTITTWFSSLYNDDNSRSSEPWSGPVRHSTHGTLPWWQREVCENRWAPAPRYYLAPNRRRTGKIDRHTNTYALQHCPETFRYEPSTRTAQSSMICHNHSFSKSFIVFVPIALSGSARIGLDQICKPTVGGSIPLASSNT